jgi:hypothetical protein
MKLLPLPGRPAASSKKAGDGTWPADDAQSRPARELDVSCPELDRLVAAALEAGRAGPNCAAGGGGNMIALSFRKARRRCRSASRSWGGEHLIYRGGDSVNGKG